MKPFLYLIRSLGDSIHGGTHMANLMVFSESKILRLKSEPKIQAVNTVRSLNLLAVTTNPNLFSFEVFNKFCAFAQVHDQVF